MSGIVVTDGLTKRYRNTAALVDCTLSVRRGEVFGLLGPNGAGKTTLLRLLMGYLRPTDGAATIDGLDCYRQSAVVHQRVAYLPGEVRLFRHLRGADVLDFFVRLRKGGSRARAFALADRLQLDLSRRVAAMSTGMRQKLALAATLGSETPLVILDEPTANLDPTVRSEVLALVAEAKQAGRAVVFSSHVLSEVEQACDRVVILRGGRLVHTQVMHDLRRKHRIRAQLAGAMPPPPAGISDQLTIVADRAGQLTIDTPGELSPLLGWLSTLPLSEVRIEPIGLQAVYDEFHSGGSDTSPRPRQFAGADQ